MPHIATLVISAALAESFFYFVLYFYLFSTRVLKLINIQWGKVKKKKKRAKETKSTDDIMQVGPLMLDFLLQQHPPVIALLAISHFLLGDEWRRPPSHEFNMKDGRAAHTHTHTLIYGFNI